ncbi:MAG: hypothetical protein U0931_11235 [Vulcanimicrobiota bacterium]
MDGTNLHWDFDHDFGFHAFGTRRDSFNLLEGGIAAFYSAHPNLTGAASLFLEYFASTGRPGAVLFITSVTHPLLPTPPTIRSPVFDAWAWKAPLGPQLRSILAIWKSPGFFTRANSRDSCWKRSIKANSTFPKEWW